MRPEEYGVMFRVEDTHWWYQALHRLIFQTLDSELPDWREKEILDAGCGTGSILKQLGNAAKNVGVDFVTGGSFLLPATRSGERTSCRYF